MSAADLVCNSVDSVFISNLTTIEKYIVPRTPLSPDLLPTPYKESWEQRGSRGQRLRAVRTFEKQGECRKKNAQTVGALVKILACHFEQRLFLEGFHITDL